MIRGKNLTFLIEKTGKLSTLFDTSAGKRKSNSEV